MSELIVFDVESTGKDVNTDQVIEFAVKYGLGKDSKEETWRVRPLCEISEGAQQVHGISMEDVKDCPTFSQIGKKIYKLLSDAEIWVGYNLDFDIQILQSEFRRNGFPEIDLSSKIILDPYKLWLHKEPRKLVNAYKRFTGKDLEGAHAANIDTSATAEVFVSMLVEYELAGQTWRDIAEICEPERTSWIGGTKHFQWCDDKPVVGIGKHAGKPIMEVKLESKGYFNWMVQQSYFPRHVREIADKVREFNSEVELSKWLSESYNPPPPSAE